MQSKKQNRWRRILRKAANLLEKGEWLKYVFIKTDNGEEYACPCTPTLNAHAFCAVGAVRQASVTRNNPALICKDGSLAAKKLDEYSKKRNGYDTMTFNDAIATEKSQVVKLLRDCANAD